MGGLQTVTPTMDPAAIAPGKGRGGGGLWRGEGGVSDWMVVAERVDLS